MYPSSSSSSSQGSMGPSGLVRYGSAPDSFLSTAVDSVVGAAATRDFSALAGSQTHRLVARPRYFPAGCGDTSSITSEAPSDPKDQKLGVGGHVQRAPYFVNEISIGSEFAGAGSNFNLRTGGGGPSSSSASPSLVRHSSSPAGFLNQLAASTATSATATAAENGFSVTRGMGGYNSKGVSDSSGDHGIARLNSQLSFTGQEALSQISEEQENVSDGIGMEDGGHRKSSAHSYGTTASFGLGCSWEDTNTIVFSAPSNKQAKSISGDVVHSLNSVEARLQFGLTQGALEMAAMEKLLHIPQDSVPCKIRAKRGCATHPRSIAERERRTRISGKLKKLQELVPNMDKQTSYADMLDLAVQHIKGLQNQVQKLKHDQENCTCGCKEPT